jgi:hypothetical protein
VAVVRPTAAALAPCGLNGLGRSRPPAVPGCGRILAWPTRGLHVVCRDADIHVPVEAVESVTDGAMLGIGVPAPRNPYAARPRTNNSQGVRAPCPVYVRSPDQLNASAEFNAPHSTH